MAFVLDASVALSWCFEDEDSGADEIIRLLNREVGIVPAHWPLEVANGLLVAERRGRLSRAQAEDLYALTAALPVSVEPSIWLAGLAVEARVAREQSLTVYDAAYIALAARRSIPLYTLDGALMKAASRMGVVVRQGD